MISRSMTNSITSFHVDKSLGWLFLSQVHCKSTKSTPGPLMTPWNSGQVRWGGRKRMLNSGISKTGHKNVVRQRLAKSFLTFRAVWTCQVWPNTACFVQTEGWISNTISHFKEKNVGTLAYQLTLSRSRKHTTLGCTVTWLLLMAAMQKRWLMAYVGPVVIDRVLDKSLLWSLR